MNTTEDNDLLEKLCAVVFELSSYVAQKGDLNDYWEPRDRYYTRETFPRSKAAGVVGPEMECFFITWDGVWDDNTVVRIGDGRLLKLTFDQVRARFPDQFLTRAWELHTREDGTWFATIRRMGDGVRETYASGATVNHAVFRVATEWIRSAQA